jgi:hypothetical protein
MKKLREEKKEEMKMIGKTIKLTDSEIRICKFIAAVRFKTNRASNVHNEKFGHLNDHLPDENGMAGEMCFAKMFNLYPDLNTELRSSRHDETDFDFVLNNGFSVDVKTTQYKTGRLLVKLHKKSKPDHLFALMIGENFEYTFKGFIHSEEMIDPQRIIKIGSRYIFSAGQYELKELDAAIYYKINWPMPCSNASTIDSSFV